jgi:hypothetical protein
MGISVWLLAPKKLARDKDPKFLFCPKCEKEGRYDAKLDGEPCPQCMEEPRGVLVGQAVSIKDAARKSPWKRVYLALAFEGVGLVATILFLLSRNRYDLSSIYYVFYCPHCSQRLRFRHVSLGGIGQCSRCRRPVRFPVEENAMREEDLMREEEERRLAEEEGEQEEEEE